MEIIKFIGIIILTIGVTLIYDARPITKKRFSFGDQNEGTKSLKIIGLIMSIIGSFIFIIIEQIGMPINL